MSKNKINKFFSLLMIIWVLSSCTETNNIKQPEIENKEVYKTSEERIQVLKGNIEKAKSKINTPTENYITKNIEEKALEIDDRCIGCGKCVRISPVNFAMDFDTRKAVVISQDNNSSDRVDASINICPTDSISLS